VNGAARFITLEGGEGTGKTTQAVKLADALCRSGIPVLRTREPGGSPGAEVLRGLLLSGQVDWAPQAETLLHFAARADHVARVIRPALEAGMWVVCDRFHDSTMAYQGYGQGADHHLIQAQIDLLGLTPDLTLVLTADAAITAARRRRRGGPPDRYERQDPAFHERVNAGFLAIARAEPARCHLVPADAPEPSVHAAILDVLAARFGLDQGTRDQAHPTADRPHAATAREGRSVVTP
jgi:dTMP kinase